MKTTFVLCLLAASATIYHYRSEAAEWKADYFSMACQDTQIIDGLSKESNHPYMFMRFQRAEAADACDALIATAKKAESNEEKK